MAARSLITVADFEAALSAFGADPRLTASRAQQRAALRDLHDLLISTAPSTLEPPGALATAATLIAGTDPAAADAMRPRPRTVFRLLRAGALAAAWAVVTENAAGRVDDPVTESTATGARRTTRRLPVATRFEAPTVYAALPGFRDPRYDAPDECYDISSVIRLEASADDVAFDGDVVSVGGSAALGSLSTNADERVRACLVQGGAEVWFEGLRHRRPDLFPGREQLSVRRDWAGWSAEIDCSRLVPGAWRIDVEVDHDGIVRRAPAGGTTDGSGVGIASTTADRGAVRIEVRRDGWWLVVSSPQVPG